MDTLKANKSSEESFKTIALPVPLPVQRSIAKLGADIGLARRRRRITQASLAERVGASVSTIKRIEAGDLRVPLHFIARVLHVFGEVERLAQLLDTRDDTIGMTLMDEQLPQRIRRRKAGNEPEGL